jgi:outer membrane protein assembly factor BamB
MDRRTILVCLLTITSLVSAPARAEHTRHWRQSDFSEFEKGTAKGVAIRSDGVLTPAPHFESFADPNLAYLWAMRLDSHGHLFAAGGSDAKVLRFDDAGKPTTVFESTELAAQAIAFDGKDNLYVATSPDGKVYKVTPDGQKSVFFDPKTKYIWALAFDSQGTLFVATGDKGEVFAVTPDGKSALFYQSNERHARSLALDSKGNLLVGTAPAGLILRLEIVRKAASAIPEAGSPFVVYETAKSEVTSLVTDAAGNIYAAAVGEKTHVEGTPLAIQNAAPVLQMSVPAGAPQDMAASQQAQALALQAAPVYPFPSPSMAGAEVVKIAPDGSPETLWTSRESLVFAMGFSSGKLLLGTGNTGEIIELEGNRVYSAIAKTNSAQVTSLLAGTDGKIFAATANPGKIFVLGPGYEPNGTFESTAFDAEIYSRWGRLDWWGENGAAEGKVEFYVRSGNTSDPEANWSDWAGPYSQPAGETVGCPPARFAQWKAVFSGAAGGAGPTVSWVSLAYLPKNIAPVIDDIAVQDPGIRVAGFAPPLTGPGTPVPVQLRNPRGPGGNAYPPALNAETSPKAPKMEVPAQGFEDKGYQAVLWSAHDDNDDDLVYSVYYRGEGEQNWRLLKDNLTQRYYSWDTTSMPDGAYYLKVVASDSPSNPADQALSTERESERFEIANTPPKIESLLAKPDGSDANVSFDAISSFASIAQARYSLDAGEWKVIFPEGLLSDAPRETYEIRLSGLSAGEHTIAVQVNDRFDNTTAAEATFTIAGSASQ